jgi:hypothetical protein
MTVTAPRLSTAPGAEIVHPHPERIPAQPTHGGQARRGASGRTASPVLDRSEGPSISCVFCRDQIDSASFALGADGHRRASCANCGLRVSVTAATWARWTDAQATSAAAARLGERLRARRVASAAQLILEKVAHAEDDPLDNAVR